MSTSRREVVISGSGVFTPPDVITNEELVEAFNAFAEKENARHADAIAAGSTPAEAATAAAVAPFSAAGRPVRAGVGLADDSTTELTEMIEQRPRAEDLITEVVRYRVPGPGAAGGFWWPADA